MPAAFIETAWRRYTKHSKNKAQEIQGAIIPLKETFRKSNPFIGAVLAGEFTAPSLWQLRSLGFVVVHIPYSGVVDVFARFGISAKFDEQTSDNAIRRQVNAYQRLSEARRTRMAAELIAIDAQGVARFIESLKATISRQIERIIILPLHGSSHEEKTIDDAVDFINNYDDKTAQTILRRYEIILRYNNGDTIEGRFAKKEDAVEYLRGYQPVPSA